MKHGVAFRKFSRTSSHRNLMLRNLVTSLFEHERIQTTLPKARDTARLAEKIITMGKKGTIPAYRRAQSFLLKTTLLPRLFTTFAQRYADRPGGYTRIHKVSNRFGDNAPMAILELVDNPRDIKLEITARAIGRDLLNEKLRHESPSEVINKGINGTEKIAKKGPGAHEYEELRPKTRLNLQKVLKYRGDSALTEVGKKATEYIETMLAKPVQQFHDRTREAVRARKRSERGVETTYNSTRVDLFTTSKAGAAVPGEIQPAFRLAQGALARPLHPKRTSHRLLGLSEHPKPTPLNIKTVFRSSR